MRKTSWLFFLGVFLLFPVGGRASDVKEVYQQNCTKCHGADGKGQTTVGKKFKVPDFTDSAWQAKTSVSKIKEVIENGVKDKAGKELMKPYKDNLSPEEVNDLVQYVQKFASEKR
jgi:mono/diheme cytochrome c family protein